MTLSRNENELTSIAGGDKINTLASINPPHKWRAYRDNYALAQQLQVTTPYPLQIDFELNATCNLACPMCPLSMENNASKMHHNFSFELFCEIIDDGVKKGLCAIKLNYLNEPLLRKDLEKFITYAKKAGVLDVYFSTNGLLLTPMRAQSLMDAGLDRIQISIDAFSPQVYDEIRPGSNYERVISHVLALMELKKQRKSLTPLVRVNFVRTEKNEQELEEFCAFWEKRVDMIGVQEMIKPTASPASIYSQTTQKKHHFRCSFPYKQLVITAEGEVLPCCTFWGEKMSLGNIFSDRVQKGYVDIEGFWNGGGGGKMQALRELHKKGLFYKHDICKQCVLGAIKET